jgi:hypothetical protein
MPKTSEKTKNVLALQSNQTVGLAVAPDAGEQSERRWNEVTAVVYAGAAQQTCARE